MRVPDAGALAIGTEITTSKVASQTEWRHQRLQLIRLVKYGQTNFRQLWRSTWPLIQLECGQETSVNSKLLGE